MSKKGREGLISWQEIWLISGLDIHEEGGVNKCGQERGVLGGTTLNWHSGGEEVLLCYWPA